MVPPKLSSRPWSELPEGQLATDRQTPDGVIYSLTAHALAEMERDRWIESESAGTDRGPMAYHNWVRRCWRGWVRSKLLEHLYGWRCWSAFSPSKLGLLNHGTTERHISEKVLHDVAALLAEGGENLDVINWAVCTQQPLPGIMWLLDRIDINAARQRLLDDHIRLFLPPVETR